MQGKIVSYETRRLFAQKIRRLRKSRGWSQEMLAEASGLHRTYIGAVERCERNISLDNLTRIAAALDTDIATLFTRSENHLQIREDSASYRPLLPSISSKILQQHGQIGL